MKKFKSAKDIKVGVIGYGGAFNMGQSHMNEMKKAGMTPFAVCEIDPSRLEVATQDFPGIETYDNLDKMLKQSDVDIITHITPHNLHYPLAAKCLKAGKGVITEKPFVITTAECDKLIKLAEQKKIMLSTYHNRHWDGWIMRAKQQIVDKGVIGDVVRIEAEMGTYGMPNDWWRTSRSISGGILYDWGVHLLEYALQIIPSEVTEVTGFATHGFWEAKAPKGFSHIGDMNEDDARAIVRFANGAMIDLTVSQLLTSPAKFMTIHGTEGSYNMAMGDGGWTLRKPKKKKGGGYEIVEKTGAHPNDKGYLFYKNIADAMTGKDKLIITPQWARRPIHVLDLAVNSAKQGKTLKAKYG